jgi:outer membrane immunogenic protein
MKKLLLAGISIAALVGPAMAADLARPVYRAPVAVAVPVYTWTGWYAGLNAGWVDATGQVNTNAAPVSFPFGDPNTICGTPPCPPQRATQTLAAAATSQLNNKRSGFIGGGQFGYNYQFGAFVAGVETDIQGSSLRGDTSTANSVLTDTTLGTNRGLWLTDTTVSRRLDYFGTLRARIGVTATPAFLLYATGGLAYGGVRSDTSLTVASNVFGVPTAVTSGSFSENRAGWTVGGGLEWMFLRNWSAKLEYLYYDLGSATYATGGYSLDVLPTALPGGGIAAIATNTSVHFRGDIVRVGLNYKFGYAAAPGVYR